MIQLTTPIDKETIRSLKVGDAVSINGVVVTGRDAAHKYIIDNLVKQQNPQEKEILDKLQKYLDRGIIYHCGPVVKKEGDAYSFVSAGPTTSIREEPYQADVIRALNMAGVIGKGGMKGKTLQACQEHAAVYFHAIGGAGCLIAKNAKKVKEVLKLDFGVPEAFWVIEVEDMRCIVTMDSHGNSLHEKVEEASRQNYLRLIS